MYILIMKFICLGFCSSVFWIDRVIPWIPSKTQHRLVRVGFPPKGLVSKRLIMAANFKFFGEKSWLMKVDFQVASWGEWSPHEKVAGSFLFLRGDPAKTSKKNTSWLPALGHYFEAKGPRVAIPRCRWFSSGSGWSLGTNRRRDYGDMLRAPWPGMMKPGN